MNYKKQKTTVLTFVITVALGSSLLQSGQVYAATSVPQCDAFQSKKALLNKSIQDKYNKIKQARQGLDSNLAKESAKSDSSLKNKQQSIDASLKKSIKGLHDKAVNQEQHAAVDEYGKAVALTVMKYRQVNAAARVQFDQGVIATLQNYRSDIDNTVKGVTSSYEAVVDEAIKVCYKTGVKKGEDFMRQSLKAASDKYSSSLRNLNDRIAELNGARKQALQAAAETQDEELLAAQEALTAAFGSDSSKVIGR